MECIFSSFGISGFHPESSSVNNPPKALFYPTAATATAIANDIASATAIATAMAAVLQCPLLCDSATHPESCSSNVED